MTLPRVAVFTKNRSNPAYDNFRVGADRAAALLGLRAEHFVPAREDNVEDQTKLVLRLLDDPPDAVVFTPVDDGLMVGPVRALSDRGVQIVSVINRMAGDFVSFVGSDDRGIGAMTAERLAAALGGRGRVVLIDGLPAAPTSRERGQGCRETLARYPGVEVVAQGSANYHRAEAAELMAAALRDHEAVDGVWAANDVMALGALEALDAAGRKAQVVGVNGIAEAVERIGDGSLLASADFNTFRIANIAMAAAARRLKGLPVPPQITLAAELIDADNWRDFLVAADSRPVLRWEDLFGEI